VEHAEHHSSDSDEHDAENCGCSVCIKDEVTDAEDEVLFNNETVPKVTSEDNGSPGLSAPLEESQSIDQALTGGQRRNSMEENGYETPSIRRSSRRKRKVDYHDDIGPNMSDQAGPSRANNPLEPTRGDGHAVSQPKKRRIDKKDDAGSSVNEPSRSIYIIR